MLKLIRFLRNYKKEVILGPLFKLFEAIFEIIVPLVMAKIIDVGIRNNDKTYIMQMCGVIILLGVCGLVFALVAQYYAARCGIGFGTELRRALYKHINSLSYAEIDKFGTSSLITRMINDTTTAQTGVNMVIRLAVRAPFLVIGSTIMAMILDIKLSVIFLVAAPIITLVLYLIMSRSIRMYRGIQKKLDRVSLLTRENLEGVRVIRASSKQNEEKEDYNKASEDVSRSAIIVGKISSILNPATYAVMNLAIVAVLWFGGMRADTGSLTQGQIIAFVNYLTQISFALIALANLVIIFTKAEASSNRINEVFEVSSNISDGAYELEYKENVPVVEFKNVSFSYGDEGESAVERISFQLNQGEILGIIGGTGSGKSTIANLVGRFYDVTQGEVLLYGSNVKEYSLKSLRKTIGIVPQKAVLFSGTILENMRWTKADATETEIVEALKIAQAWEFVEKLDDGIHSGISQGGKNFSGGQKQRLTIARAFVGTPPIVILDDSMSALDYATDLALRKSISEKLSDTTLIMISQRSTSIKNADKIMVLDDGEIVGMGTHDELYNSCEIYKEICDIQGEAENEKGS
ncbi:MAG TPA: ABC transporter ATP-binding protein [Clostridiales bacterium]|nr:ABC transporter ATP-binding protein [Clostridiales bacterium]